MAQRIVRGVLFVVLAAGLYGLLPRLAGLSKAAAALRHTRPGFVVAGVVAGAVSLASSSPIIPGGLGVVEVTLVAVSSPSERPGTSRSWPFSGTAW